MFDPYLCEISIFSDYISWIKVKFGAAHVLDLHLRFAGLQVFGKLVFITQEYRATIQATTVYGPYVSSGSYSLMNLIGEEEQVGWLLTVLSQN